MNRRPRNHGPWRSGEEIQQANIAVIEAMAAKLAPAFWRSLCERRELELSQEKIVIAPRKSLSCDV